VQSEKDLSTEIQTGNFFVDFLIVDPPDMISLFEVHLQTICLKVDGKLPVLNQRIG